jgi:catechol 2,3-dioxygenase-like lactoylglutathione lyase family enzyme
MTQQIDHEKVPVDQRGPLSFLAGGIAQVALIVPDLDQAVERYWRLFGIGPWTFYTYGKPLVKRMTYGGRESDYCMRLALSNAGDLRLELIEIVRGDTVYADFVARHGYGVQHLGVLVDDMQRALEKARAAGWTVTQDGAGFGADGDGHYAYLDTEEALGVVLELIERPKGRVRPEKVYPPPTEDSHGS